MDLKKIRKNIGYFFGWVGINTCSFIIKFIPQGWLYGFANKASGIGYRFARKQRNIALESLGIAFSQERSASEIERIARNCFTFMAKSAIELMFLMDRSVLLRKRVQISGENNLKDALGKGKGVILVSAHFGNFPLMMAKLSLEGYKIAGIMRPMRDAKAESIFLKKRNKLGIKTIYSQPRKECVDSCIRTLRNNELLFIPIDQNFGTGGVFVDFFGTKAATATGPVVLAQRTGASIIPCFIVRQKDDTHRIIFEPAIELKKGATDEETIIANIQKLTNIIESYIRIYPQEWGWIHRRWKSKPS